MLKAERRILLVGWDFDARIRFGADGQDDGGRKSVMTDDRRNAAESLLKTQMTPREIAGAIGVSLSTFYRHFPGK